MIVIPCYNEAARLDVHTLRDWVCECSNVDLLFVDDGSTDATGDVIEMLVESNPERFSLYRLPQNMGKAEAVRRGILYALEQDFDFVGFWDADLATPLQAIQEFCQVLEQNSRLKMVMGSRVRLLGRRIDRRPLRHYLGRVFATAASAVVGLSVYDTQCGAKIFRSSPDIHEVFGQAFGSRWIFDVELLARLICITKLADAQRAGDIIYEVPLMEWRDVAGSKVTLLDFLKAARELMSIYWRYFGARRARTSSAKARRTRSLGGETVTQPTAMLVRLPPADSVEPCGMGMTVNGSKAMM